MAQDFPRTSAAADGPQNHPGVPQGGRIYQASTEIFRG